MIFFRFRADVADVEEDAVTEVIICGVERPAAGAGAGERVVFHGPCGEGGRLENVGYRIFHQRAVEA